MKKSFIIIGILFAVLLGAAELYVRSEFFEHRIRPIAVSALKDLLGQELQIGRITANLVPLFVEARDISLPDGAGREIAAVRKIRIYVNPLSLLFKKIRLSSIVLLQPRIHAARFKDGELNLLPLITRIRSQMSRNPSSGPPRFKVIVKSITVRQGRVWFSDAMSGARFSLSGLQTTVKLSSGGGGTFTVKQGEVQATTPGYPEFFGNVKASLRWDNRRFHLDSFAFTTGDTVFLVNGSVGSVSDPELNLRVRLRSGPQTIGKFTGLIKRLKKEPQSRVEASATIQGRLSNPSVDGLFQLTGVSYEGFQLKDAALSFAFRNNQFTAAGQKWKIVRGNKSILINSINSAFEYSARGLDIQRFEVEAGDLLLKASGRADPQRGFDSLVSAESWDNGRTLSFLTSLPLEGAIRLKGAVTGLLNAPVFDGNLSAGPFSVRGISFDDASGSLQYRQKKISLVSVDIHQKASRYFFNGSVDFAGPHPLLNATLRAVRSDVGSIVALFYKPLPLRLTGNGDLAFSGTTNDFTGTCRLSLESGSAYGESFDKAAINAVVTRDGISFPQVLIHKGSGTVGGTGWIGFKGTYEASVESRGVTLSEVDHLRGMHLDGVFDLAIESGGSFARPVVTAALNVHDLLLNRTAMGGMDMNLQIKDRMLTSTASMADEHMHLSARLGLVRPYPLSARVEVDVRGADPFLVVTSNELQGRTRLTAAGNISFSGNLSDSTSIAGSATFQRLAFFVGDYRIENSGPVALSLAGDRIAITSLNMEGQGTKLAVTGGAKIFKEINLSLSGTSNLSMLRPLFNQLEHTDGTAEVRLAIRESWAKPEIDGEVLIKDGEIKIRDIRQKISSLSGKITFDGSRIVADSATGEFGGGTFKASGKAELAGLSIRDFSSRAVFDNVTVKHPEGLSASFSGEVNFDGNNQEQLATGEVFIKRARYDKRIEWKSMLVAFGKGLAARRTGGVGAGIDTQFNVRFYGKDNILFQNNLAKVPLDVDVILHGTLSHPQLLGRVEARQGSVYFRQNEFKILHASADFVDPNRINPVLDIQAEIQVREYMIRMAVSGTADRAVVTLLSDPSLPDSDILALLALRKTGTELKGRESGVGMSEAASFASGKFQDIFESRARSLTGLDRFQIDPYVSTGETAVPRVTVGKEIVQDKVFITYSSNVGAAMPEQIFRVEYILNKHFSLVGERNELGNTWADIKYRIDFK
jgi:autotransporter translocation and assembly factor TamB